MPDNEAKPEGAPDVRENVYVSLADEKAYGTGYRQGVIDILWIIIFAVTLAYVAYRMVNYKV